MYRRSSVRYGPCWSPISSLPPFTPPTLIPFSPNSEVRMLIPLIADNPNHPTIDQNALQEYIDSSPYVDLEFTPSPTPYTFDKPLRINVDKHVSIRGRPGAILRCIGPEALFQFYSVDPNKWDTTTELKGLQIESLGPCFSSIDPPTGGRTKFPALWVTDCRLISWEDYCIWFPNLTYSIAMNFLRVRCQGRGGLFLGGDIHTTSGLSIKACYVQVAGDRRIGPSICISGARMWSIEDTIVEGTWGYSPGADPSKYNNIHGIRIHNPGFYNGVIDKCWFEYDGTPPKNHYWVGIVQDYKGSTGSANPSTYTLSNSDVRYLLLHNDPSSTVPMLVRLEAPVLYDPGAITIVGNPVVTVDGAIGLGSAINYNDLPTQRISNSLQEAVGGRIGLRDKPVADIIYAYPGGTGNDGRLREATYHYRTEVYPHRHPVHGACIALYSRQLIPGNFSGLYGWALEDIYKLLPLREGKRVFQRYYASSPHFERFTGHLTVWAKLQIAGFSDFRPIPSGFTPEMQECSLTIRGGWSNYVFGVEECYDRVTYSGWVGDQWILIYGASVSLGSSPDLRLGYGAASPITCHTLQETDWDKKMVAPLGTWLKGDRVLTLIPSGLSLESPVSKEESLAGIVCLASGTKRKFEDTNGTLPQGKVISMDRVGALSGIGSLLEGDYVRVITGGGAKTPGELISYKVRRIVTIDPLEPVITLSPTPPNAVPLRKGMEVTIAPHPAIWGYLDLPTAETLKE